MKFLEISEGLDDLINTSNGIISSTSTLSGNLADGYLSIWFWDDCLLLTSLVSTTISLSVIEALFL